MVELEPIPEEDETLEIVAHQRWRSGTHGRVHIMSDMTRNDAQR